jgi:hypothetical protein
MTFAPAREQQAHPEQTASRLVSAVPTNRRSVCSTRNACLSSRSSSSNSNGSRVPSSSRPVPTTLLMLLLQFQQVPRTLLAGYGRSFRDGYDVSKYLVRRLSPVHPLGRRVEIK